MALEARYQAMLDTILKEIDKMKTEDLEKTAVELSRRGLFTSPFGTKPLLDVKERYANLAASKAAELGLAAERDKTAYEQWQAQQALAQWFAQQQLELQKQQLAEQQRQAREYEEAVRKQQENWWQPIVGGALGTAIAGPLGGAIGSSLGGAIGSLFGTSAPKTQKPPLVLPSKLSLYSPYQPYYSPYTFGG